MTIYYKMPLKPLWFQTPSCFTGWNALRVEAKLWGPANFSTPLYLYQGNL